MTIFSDGQGPGQTIIGDVVHEGGQVVILIGGGGIASGRVSQLLVVASSASESLTSPCPLSVLTVPP